VMAREHGWISSGVVECNDDDELTLLIARPCHRALRRRSPLPREPSAYKLTKAQPIKPLRAVLSPPSGEHGAE
jgi:hypothetical protein